MPIVNRVSDLQPDIMAWRRDLHAHPELMYDVHRTAAFVADRLREFGCDEVATGLGRTGVVGVIKGRKPVNQDFYGALIPAQPALDLKGIAIALADGISSSEVSSWEASTS